MSRAVMRSLLGLVLFVAFFGTASGQSSSAKPAQKAAPAKASAPPATPPDVKIQTKYTSGAQVSVNTMYLKGERQRVEFPGVVSIEQCDAGQTLVINPAAKTYFVNKHAVPSTGAPAPDPAAGADASQANPPAQEAGSKPPSGGVVTYTMSVHDTGERKQVFGREARHVTTTMTKAASASACDKTPLTIETDGWYIDFAPVSRCRVASVRPPVRARRMDVCVDQVESRVSGDARLGFPIAMTTTTKTGDGDKAEVQMSSMEVAAFEVKTLDAALFEAPAGYTEVTNNTALMATYQGGAAGLDEALLGSTADGTGTAAPKRAGTVRIGVLEPVDKSTLHLPTRELRRQLASAFHPAEPYEALPLPGNSPAEAQGDATRLECDYVLSVEIAEVKTSKPGKMGGLLKKVSRQGPSSEVHEVKLDYRLHAAGAPGGSPVFSERASASSGGFGLRSALNLARTAASLYMRSYSLALLNPMLASNLGGGLGPLAAAGVFDPRATAMSSMSVLFDRDGLEATGDGSAATAGPALASFDPDLRRTIEAAFADAAKGTLEQLKKNGGKSR